ncbi:alkaline phosphatase family protein [Roseivirga echinicomitans]
MKKYLKFILLVVILAAVSLALVNRNKETPYVIMVSFDGFRHDYVEKYNAVNFQKFMELGASAEAMIPSFPSKTFPNHYSLVTGLYPGNHGLVDNNFYDRDLDLRYSMGNRSVVENPAFYGGLPLWQLVQQNGMKSASYFWVGSESPVAGSFPNYYEIYDGKVSNEARISAVMDWLKLPEAERPNYISLYFSLVDDQGHGAGPNGAKASVLEADRLLGVLMEALEQIDLPVNVIVTSDHGMNEVASTEENLIDIEEVLTGLDAADFLFVNSGALAHLYIEKPEKIEEIYDFLKARENNFTVYKKEDLKANWHYQHDRVGEILLVTEPDHYITSRSNKARLIANGGVRGEHGFDPYVTEDMATIFYAQGPNIKPGSKIPKFENVDIYPFVAHILGISELPEIDGKLETLKSIYKK